MPPIPMLRQVAYNIKAYLLVAAMVLCISTMAQPGDYKRINFRAADSVALRTRWRHDIIRLSKDLTGPFDQPVLKVRAIYRWITDNVAYDYKLFNQDREPKSFRCKDALDCNTQKELYEWKLAEKTARSGKAVCGGYAQLFRQLCLLAGVNCEIVSGAVRTKPYQVGNNAPFDHAWNAVYLDTQWYFIDATWAAGSCSENENTGKLTAFHKNLNDFYFLTPPAMLVRNHWPKEKQWQTRWPGFNRDRFNAQPFFYGGSHFVQNIHQLTPDSGVLNVRVKDIIYFSFDYAPTIERIQVNTNLRRSPGIWDTDKKGNKFIDSFALRKQLYWPFKKEGNRYTIEVPVHDRSLYWLEILFRYPGTLEPVQVLRYRLNVISP